jgi:acyl carrier protein phosphodiesterase
MNFLAHIHLAKICNSNICGNLLGDFVKGNPTGKFPEEVTKGIVLHRFVDKFTDQHELSRQAKALFIKPRQRFAPIALDIFWDHCLVSDWPQYSDVPLEQFCVRSMRQVRNEQEGLTLPERYVLVTQNMWQNSWLLSYGEMDNIGHVLYRMSKRSARMEPLANCHTDLLENYSELRLLFTQLYPQVIDASQRYRQLNHNVG